MEKNSFDDDLKAMKAMHKIQVLKDSLDKGIQRPTEKERRERENTMTDKTVEEAEFVKGVLYEYGYRRNDGMNWEDTKEIIRRTYRKVTKQLKAEEVTFLKSLPIQSGKASVYQRTRVKQRIKDIEEEIAKLPS